MEVSQVQKFDFVNKNKKLIFLASFKPYGLSFLLVILSISLQRTVLAANEPNQFDPNTVPGLLKQIFEESYFKHKSIYSHQEIIDKIIQILEKESAEESLSKLSEYELYMWPGPYWVDSNGYSVDIPLDKLIGKDDILKILGNRRFLKAIQDLSAMPKEKAANLVNKELNSSLQEYNQLFDSVLERNAKFFEKDPKIRSQNHEEINFGGHMIGGKPILRAMRYKVLALVLIAGNLELKQCQPAVAKVLETAIEQRNRFYDKDLWNVSDSFTVLIYASLYNRQILATSILVTSIDKEKADEVLKNTGRKMANEKLTKFDSPVAVYDLPPWQQEEPIDYIKGELNIKYLAPLSDSAFDNLINAVKIEQQKSIKPEDANGVVFKIN
jgi:hypothetical protein